MGWRAMPAGGGGGLEVVGGAEDEDEGWQGFWAAARVARTRARVVASIFGCCSWRLVEGQEISYERSVGFSVRFELGG